MLFSEEVSRTLGQQEHASEDEIKKVEQELEDRQSHASEEEIQDVERDLEET